MSDITDALQERRQKLILETQDIARKGVTEGRDLSVEEQTGFDQRIAEVDALDTRIKALSDGELRAKDLEESFRKVTGKELDQRAGEGEGAFGKFLRETRGGGEYYDLQGAAPGAERRAQRAIIENRAMSASNGLGKDGVYGQLWEFAVTSSQILQAGVDIFNTADGNTLPLPSVTAHATGSSAAANAPITASDAVLTTADLSVTKDGYITLVPTELLQDATFDLEGYVARAAGRELGLRIAAKAEAAAIAGFTASGATVATGNLVNGATGSVAFSDAIIDLFHSVNPAYRNTAAWVMADPTMGLVRKVKDGSGQYVWERTLVPGNPITVDNKPLYVANSFDATYITAAKKIIYFGDWAALKVRIAGGLRFERSNDYAFGNDQVAFRAIVRSGAVAVDVNAVKFLVTTAA